jgi:hypothetical protein
MRAILTAFILATTIGLGRPAQAEMPKAESDFIATIQDARTVFDIQTDKARKSALVKEMEKRWTAILPGGRLHGWVGQIVEVGANKAGKLHIAIRIADNVNLMTWEKAITDLGHGTLIGPRSPLYPVLSAMKPGDTVRFDGRYETFVNLNDRAKVFNTDLIVAFSAIAPAS